MSGGPAGVSPELLEIIVCPACHGELVLTGGGAHDDAPHDDGAELDCQGCDLVYPVRDGIPVLLVDEARSAG